MKNLWLPAIALATCVTLSCAARSEVAGQNRQSSALQCAAGQNDGANQGSEPRKESCIQAVPRLIIDPGTHTSNIYSAAVDPGCRRLVTGSADNTVRVWNLPDASLARTIRFPFDAKGLSKINVVGVSKDGRWAAAAGLDARLLSDGQAGIYVFDLEGGSYRRIGSLKTVISSIAISPRGDQIAVGLVTGDLHVLDAVSGAELWRGERHGGQISGLVFDANGQLFSSSIDGNIRKYDGRGTKVAAADLHDLGMPGKIDLSPSGIALVVGYDVSVRPVVTILDARNLKVMTTTKALNYDSKSFGSVAWSQSEDYIIAAGDAVSMPDMKSMGFLTRIFDVKNSRVSDHRTESLATTLSACSSAAWITFDPPAIGRYEHGRDVSIVKESAVMDLSQSAFYLAIARDGKKVVFGQKSYVNGGGVPGVIFDVSAASLQQFQKADGRASDPESAAAPFHAAVHPGAAGD